MGLKPPKLVFFVLFASLWGASGQAGQPSPAFQRAFDQEQFLAFSGRGLPDFEHQKAARQFHYVWVGGYLSDRNDSSDSYFEENLQTMERDFGIPREQISVIRPPSRNSLLQSARWLRGALLDLRSHSSDQKPLVLLGQSMGGAVVFYFSILNRDLLEEGIVARVVSIQGAFGGAVLADATLWVADGYFTRQVVPECLDSPRIPGGEMCWSSREIQEGARSLTTESAQTLSRMVYRRLSATDRDFFSSRLITIRSRAPYGELPGLMKVTGAWMERTGGDNDGTLLTQNQWIPGLGTDWGILKSDHLSLTLGEKGGSPYPREFRQAFTRLLMKRIAELP